MAELALVKLANRLVETFQKSKARGRDAGFDDAAVVCLAGARDEAALFHAVEEAGYVRVVGNHAFADAAAGEAGGFGAAENAEDVVLGAGEAMRLEELLAFQAEVVGGFLEGDEDAGFDGESGMRSGAATHAVTIVVMTTNVKRKELGRKMAGSMSGARRNSLIITPGQAGAQ
jgi:hypothetical protein